MQPVLAIDNLHTRFFTRDGVVRAIDGLSLSVQAGEVLGIVGESGCGKSVTALSVMRLIPPRSGRIVAGSVRFEGQDLAALDDAQMRRIRGNQIAMVFQEPMTSLNPVHTVGAQIAEAVRIHQGLSRAGAMARAVEMLGLVRIPDAPRRVHDYPHQFSGGMRQRVMIAMALSCNPKLLIADEPTTALDVTIQAQILKLMVDLNGRVGAAIMLITHDLGVIAETAHRVVVMYAGRKVEEATVQALFDRPVHPYTRGLMASIPRGRQGARTRRLSEIAGIVPSLREAAPGQAAFSGCAFAPRCGFATPRCHTQAPPLMAYGADSPAPAASAEVGAHLAACWEIETVLGS
ncbi:MAG: ABC transporter ATP-binding protein [Betaproteobacteria bacterium]|jgi:peptide/nickel transport system ATP-binding protein|nr:ABC transporter ATP-binding protein [Betaproteobacteria bacterium]